MNGPQQPEPMKSSWHHWKNHQPDLDACVQTEQEAHSITGGAFLSTQKPSVNKDSLDCTTNLQEIWKVNNLKDTKRKHSWI